MKLQLMHRADGSAATMADVLRWGQCLPLGRPFIMDIWTQVEYRTSSYNGKGKGSSKGVEDCNAYAMLMWPLQGKGNVTVYIKQGIVMINASEKSGMLSTLHAYVADWAA